LTTQRDTLIRLVAFLAILLLGFILAPAPRTEPLVLPTPGVSWESAAWTPGPPMERPWITRDEWAVATAIMILGVDLAIVRSPSTRPARPDEARR
jgi:hypothetical protein